VNPGDKVAEERFKEISAAYDVLSDPQKRKLYDEFGTAGLREGFDPEQARAYQSWSQGRAATGFEEGGMPGGFDFDLGDMFGDLFAGGRRAGARVSRERGEDLVARVDIELGQAIAGSEIELDLPVPRPCHECKGSGDAPGSESRTCPDCGGSGRKQAVRGPMRLMSTCATCGGNGKLRTPCPVCGGAGTITETRRTTVRIPPGADHGSRLRVGGRGAPGLNGGPPGDLVIETRVRPHPFFSRHGLNLHLKLPVTLEEAYDGATVEVPTPTGVVRLKIPPRSQQGAELRLRGKGVHKGKQQGDLYVTLDVRLPDGDSQELRQAIAEASRAYSRPLREGLRL
jgi:molecular chaperone DnaJ